MHKVLKRLLLKTLPTEFELLNNSQFIGKINQIFEQYDIERKMLERSLRLSSEELNEINTQLKVELDEKKKNEQQLHFQAYHDRLTKLPNRALLIESIDHAISLTQHSHEQVAILFLDLDDFKKINDTLGHQEGDKFLVDISQRIKSILSSYDILGRLSGDEFLIILEGIVKPNHIIKVHDQILSLFKEPFNICGHQYTVSCSIGVSTFPQDGNNSEILIRKADMAMYQAKKTGKGKVHYFDARLEQLVLNRVKIENKIREAIDKELFVFHYQPKVNLVTNKVLGVEALLRIQNTHGEIIYPDEFIYIAEESGLIRGITKKVIKKTCQTLKEWQVTHLKDVSISINITSIDFSQYNFVTDLLTAIKNSGAKPHLLQLEITESVLMDDIDNVISVINELKKHRISVAIDDFGTGYSSFSYLHDLDVDYIKIDKSFVQNVYKTQKSKAIVKSIIDLGNNLGIKVIAEGVETKREHDFLRKNHCIIGQGYYYSRPLTTAQLVNFLAPKNRR